MDSRFQTDGISLYQGDALRVLTTLPVASVDAVLTDPPYSSGGITLGARQADPSQKYQSSGTKRQYPPMLGDAKDQRSWIMWCTLWLGGMLARRPRRSAAHGLYGLAAAPVPE